MPGLVERFPGLGCQMTPKLCDHYPDTRSMSRVCGGTMAEAKKLVGQNYVTPDLVAKVTGTARYSEDHRAAGMLFTRLLLSPMPHARVTKLDLSAALAMPG